MNCLIKNCSNCSSEEAGRAICVEPDDDGWICEPCWQFLTTGGGLTSSAYALASFAECSAIYGTSDDRTDFLNDDAYDEEEDIYEEDFELPVEEVQEMMVNDDQSTFRERVTEGLRRRNRHRDQGIDIVATGIGRSQLDESNYCGRPFSLDYHSYEDLLSHKKMDQVRAGRLVFNNYTLDEKVILKLNEATIYCGDSYHRDACTCQNFACRERWIIDSNAMRSGHAHTAYVELLGRHLLDMLTRTENKLDATEIFFGP